MADADLPTISVVMPVRNEAAFITLSLGAMLQQDYPASKIEFLVVDGMSEDGTRDIVEQMAAADARIRLVDNPRRIIPAALNVGLHAARNEFVARMDGHSIAAPDYLRRCVQVLRASGADNVGGRWDYVGDSYVGSAIAAAMDSRFGVGSSRWRGSEAGGEADTVPYGFMRRERMLELGGFDERFLANEDYEFNYRLRSSGGRITYSPTIRMAYHVRPSLATLWRQYRNYGFWKARTLRVHPASVQLRQLVPPLFVLGLVTGWLLLVLGAPWGWLYLAGVGAYVFLALLFAARQATRHGWRLFLLIPPVFATLHVAWGTGFLVGVVRWFLLDRRD